MNLEAIGYKNVELSEALAMFKDFCPKLTDIKSDESGSILSLFIGDNITIAFQFTRKMKHQYIVNVMVNEKGGENLDEKTIEEVEAILQDELRGLEDIKFSQDYRTIAFNFRNVRSIAYQLNWVGTRRYRVEAFKFDPPDMPEFK